MGGEREVLRVDIVIKPDVEALRGYCVSNTTVLRSFFFPSSPRHVKIKKMGNINIGNVEMKRQVFFFFFFLTFSANVLYQLEFRVIFRNHGRLISFYVVWLRRCCNLFNFKFSIL